MQHLLLLHGAIGSSGQLQELKTALEQDYIVHSLDLPGHGGKAMPEKFTINFFAESVVEYLEKNQLSNVQVFGYSMGGYLALYIAKNYSGAYFDKIITLGTKFKWTEDIAAGEMKMLQPGVIEQKLPAFAAVLEQRHAPNDWKMVLRKTAEMLQEMGKNNPLKLQDLATINNPVLIMLGEADKMVTREETEAVAAILLNGEMYLLPAAPHPIEQINTAVLAEKIRSYIASGK